VNPEPEIPQPQLTESQILKSLDLTRPKSKTKKKRKVKKTPLPCPFCSFNKPQLISGIFVWRQGRIHYYLCPQCGGQSRTRKSKQAALNAWNRRPNPQADKLKKKNAKKETKAVAKKKK